MPTHSTSRSNAKLAEKSGKTAASNRRIKWSRQRKIVLGLVAFAISMILIFVGVCESMIASANRPVSPRGVDLPIQPIVLQTKSDSTVSGSTVSGSTVSGSTVSGSTVLDSTVKGWSIAADQSTATVVLLHSVRGSRLTMLRRAKLLYAEGYSVVMVDMHGHGESPGDVITMGHQERHSASAAVEYAKTFANGRPVVVLGMSLGGASFLLSQQIDLDGVILESVYPTITEATYDRIKSKIGAVPASILSPMLLKYLEFRLQLSADNLRPIDQLSQLACPVLMMSGEDDLYTTEAETRRMFAQLTARPAGKQQHELWLVPAAAHVDLCNFAEKEYRLRVLDFLDRTVAKTKL